MSFNNSSDDVFEAADLHTAADVVEMEIQDRQSPASPDIIPPTDDDDSDAPGPSKRTRTNTRSPSPDFAPAGDHKRLVSGFLLHVSMWAQMLKETPQTPAIVVEWLTMRCLSAPQVVKNIVMRLNAAFRQDMEADQESFRTFSEWCGTLHDGFFTMFCDSREMEIWQQFVRESSTVFKIEFLLVVFHPSTGNDHVHIVHNCRWDRKQRRCGCSGLRMLGRAEKRRMLEYADGSGGDFDRLHNYLLQEPRRVVLQKAHSTLWVDLREYSGGPLPGPSGNTNEGLENQPKNFHFARNWSTSYFKVKIIRDQQLQVQIQFLRG